MSNPDFSADYLEEYERFGKVNATYNEYASIYNVLTQKNGAHTAVSVLSQNRTEIEGLAKELTETIKDLTHSIREYTNLSKEDPKREFVSEPLELFLGTIDGNGLDLTDDIYKEKINYFIKDFCDTNEKERSDWLIEQYVKLHNEKQKRDVLRKHLKGIKSVISKALLNEYPSEIETISYEEWKQQEEEKIGRPLDESADQRKIEIRVSELIAKGKKQKQGYKRFWHHKGRWEGSPNKNQVKKQLREDGITGELGDDAISDRINKALKVIGIN